LLCCFVLIGWNSRHGRLNPEAWAPAGKNPLQFRGDSEGQGGAIAGTGGRGQYRSAKGPWPARNDYYGLCSINLRNQQRLLAFCSRCAPGADIRPLLENERFGPILDAPPVLEDARVAVRDELQHTPPAELLASAARNSGSYGELYARFL
jgi:hypothetical protein